MSDNIIHFEPRKRAQTSSTQDEGGGGLSREAILSRLPASALDGERPRFALAKSSRGVAAAEGSGNAAHDDMLVELFEMACEALDERDALTARVHELQTTLGDERAAHRDTCARLERTIAQWSRRVDELERALQRLEDQLAHEQTRCARAVELARDVTERGWPTRRRRAARAQLKSLQST